MVIVARSAKQESAPRATRRSGGVGGAAGLRRSSAEIPRCGVPPIFDASNVAADGLPVTYIPEHQSVDWKLKCCQ